MKVGSNGYNQANINAFKENIQNKQKGAEEKAANEKDIQSQIETSAVKVSLSMNAQVVLYAMDASQLNKDNITGQKSVFEFLAGKEVEGGFSLEDIGYTGKPITELSPEEAQELLDDGGFFSVNETSKRVADFVFNFAGDDIELLKKGLEGIKQGFKEAEELWGGVLPEISYTTQNKTEELIENRISELETSQEQSSEEETAEEH